MTWQLSNFDAAVFLKEYWQQKPLLIKNALPGFASLLSSEELAGLACEEGVESRLIEGSWPLGQWSLKNGPFAADDFATLPEKNCTLLVQEVDKILPEVADMVDLFNFLPSWRFDDVMISSAEDGGSVGPHLDNYDVFLLQAQGKRQWQIGCQPILGEESLKPDCPVRILKEFSPDETFVLEPGDILYLPPRFAHHGVSLGKGMTYSFGFRSPSLAQMLVAQAEHHLQAVDESRRMVDPQRATSHNQMEFDQQDINQAIEQLKAFIGASANQSQWFGALVSKNPGLLDWSDLPEHGLYSKEQVHLLLNNADELLLSRNLDVRWAYFCGDSKIQVYINGQEFLRSLEEKEVIEWMSSKRRFSNRQWIEKSKGLDDLQEWFVELCHIGVFYFND